VRSICFICYGNICRSPAAASFALTLRTDLTITSAGFYPTAGRTSPDYIVDACRTMGTDLTGHRSRLIDAELVESSDLIVCMDHMNWQQFEKTFPEHTHKLVLLGPFGNENATTIADPYARPIPEVQTTIATIRNAVEGLLAKVPVGSGSASRTLTDPPLEVHERFLYITYDFPPARTSAVYRHVGLTKYLPAAGWRPVVISARSAPGAVEDASLLRNYPQEIDVVRTRWWRVDRLEKWIVSRSKRSSAPMAVADGPRNEQAGLDPSKKLSPLRSLVRWVDQLYRSFLYFPDKTTGWIPFAVAAGRRQIKRHGIRVVYTSSPPRSAPYVGYLLKRMTGVKWIAEFRDPWYPPPGRFRAWLERRILTHFLKAADAVLLISDGLRDEFVRSFNIPAHKLHVVSNGYDENEYVAIRPHEAFPRDRLNLSHFGTVYGGFAGRFYEALSLMIQADPSLAQKIRVNIVGFPDEQTRAAAAAPELKDVVRIYPFMEQDRALQAMQSSDVLLLFLGNRETSRLSGLGKIYWYLRVGKPVLATAYEGDCRSLILRSQCGIVAAPDSTDEIKQAIATVLDDRSRNQIRPAAAVVDEFRYDHLAALLAQVLGKVAAG
jgi:protein-tyrosine-phosphatase/glycosyltransferase involved in cell wall biosynthesis